MNKSGQLIPLGSFLQITSGGTPSRKNATFFDNGDIHWFKTGDLKRRDLLESEEKITRGALNKSSAKLFPPDTVLVAMYGATIGACGILRVAGATNQACAAFLPNKKILPEYLYYFIQFNKENFVKLGAGGAQPNISAGKLKDFRIPLHSIKDQKKIVQIICGAESSLEKRRQTIRLADEFLKSVFLEMFGEPIANTKKWPVRKLGEVLEVRDGTHDSPKYISEGIPLVTSKNLKNGGIDFTNISYISSEDQQKINKRSFVNDGDILYGMIGTIGSPVIVRKVREFCIKNVALFKFGDCGMERHFVRMLMSDDFMTKKLLGTKRGGTQKFVSLNMLRSFEIPVPPITKQQEFTDIVQKVERLKEKQKQSEAELQNLFNSLMQKAFMGNS